MGFQEPAPRPAPHSSAGRLGWWVALVAIAFATWVSVDRWSSREPRIEPEAEQSPGSEIKSDAAAPRSPATDDLAYEHRIDVLRLELGKAQNELDSQRQQVARLETELNQAKAESERHRQGLEQAVAELNRINTELDRLQSQSRHQTGPSLPPPPGDRVRPLGAPTVTTHQMGFVVASGLVHNPHDYPVRGSLEVSIVGSAGVIEARQFLMQIGPDSTERYDVTFTNIFPTERLGAQARWIE